MSKLGLFMLVVSMLVALVILPNTSYQTDFSNGEFSSNVEKFVSQVENVGKDIENGIENTIRGFGAIRDTFAIVYDWLGLNISDDGICEGYSYEYHKMQGWTASSWASFVALGGKPYVYFYFKAGNWVSGQVVTYIYDATEGTCAYYDADVFLNSVYNKVKLDDNQMKSYKELYDW